MTGFTTRTLRTYLNKGLLNGKKEDGVWLFTAEDLDKFFNEPFVNEGVRIKRNSIVFDFLADQKKSTDRACVVLDLRTTMTEGNNISSLFCKQMEEAKDVVFSFDWNNGFSRVILTGAKDQVFKIMDAYKEL